MYKQSIRSQRLLTCVLVLNNPLTPNLNSWSPWVNGECGSDGGDEHWYMGKTPCFRANVAYSLYGVKSGIAYGGNCGAHTFINSFFSTQGVAQFLQDLGLDDVGNNNDDGNNNNNNNNQDSEISMDCAVYYDDDGNGQDNNAGDYEHNEEIYPTATSSTMACNSKGQFVMGQFGGAYCNANYLISTTDDYDYLNEYLESNLGCTQIYGNGNGDDANDNDFMADSMVCSTVANGKHCPSPFGLKSIRDRQSAKRAEKKIRVVSPWVPSLSVMMILGAAVMVFLTYRVSALPKKSQLGDDDLELQDAPLMERASQSFQKVASTISERAQSFKEQLIAYAEEEDAIDNYKGPNYDAPAIELVPEAAPADDTPAERSESPVMVEKEETKEKLETNKEVADAMLAEQGVPAKKKYKRPIQARISKFFFRRRKNKTKAAI